MKQGTYYFSHDYNARSDDKMKGLIRRHGMQGYGIFWAILEDLYQNANAMRTDYEGIAFDLHSQSDIVKSVIEDFNLFEIMGEYFGSISVERRLNDRNMKSEKARQSAFTRWGDANAMRTQCDSNAIKERKGKEKKEKEIKINKESIFENWKNIEEELINSDEWINQTAYSCSVSVIQVKKRLNEFINLQKAISPNGQTLSEARRHFVNWLRKQKIDIGTNNVKIIQQADDPTPLLPEIVKMLSVKGRVVEYDHQLTDEDKKKISEYWRNQ